MVDKTPTVALLSGATRTASVTACGINGDTVTATNPIGATPDRMGFWLDSANGATGSCGVERISWGASTVQFRITSTSSGQANVFGGVIWWEAIHTQVR